MNTNNIITKIIATIIFSIILSIILILILRLVGIAKAEVIGECCKEYYRNDNGKLLKKDITPEKKEEYIDNLVDYYWKGHLCKKDKECSECLDNCWNELKENCPDTGEKLKEKEIVESTPVSDCFISIL
jgi:hypothetical protein